MHQRKLAAVQPDGHTYGQHLKAVAARSEWARRQLAGPAFPTELTYLWDYFLEISETRTLVYCGERVPATPAPIPWFEIDAWARLTHRSLRSWEVELIRALDRVWLLPPKPEETTNAGPP